uniref:Uncharacterized protein n=1 Tax=Alexandrium monilatum TaxID=311494 RepID=A0A7S4RH22_9DINO
MASHRRPHGAAAQRILLAAAGVLAATCTLVGSRGTEPSAASLNFVLGSSLPRSGAVRPGQEEPCTSTALAGALGLACAGRAASPVAMMGKRRRTWNEKQIKNYWYAKRNPKPVMPNRELMKRKTKVDLMRRIDLWSTEFYVYTDPRDARYQWSLADVKRMQENPENEDEDRLRERMGVPLAPIRMYANALEEMRGERLGLSKRGAAAADAASETTEKEQKRPERGVDLSNIDDEFLAFKGIELSKKQKAQRAANKAKKRR